MPVIDSKFKPAWWLRGRHAQTLWPSLFRRHRLPPLSRERVELDDGDFIDLAWSGPPQGPIVLFMHGLEGGLHSHYTGGILQQLVSRGYRVCFMHFRGCSGEPNRLSISYHSGKTDDPQRVVEHIRLKRESRVYAAVGVSLGGNVLLKWLGEQGGLAMIQKAVAVSVPFRLDHAARKMDTGFSRVYQRHLVRRLQRSYREKFSRIPTPLEVNPDELNSFYQFDDRVTAPLHGFNGADDYYSRSSSRQYIARIRVPTLILHARDDPFMYPDTPPEVDELPDNVWLEIPEYGGHVGFVSGWLPGWASYWGEQRIVQWLADERYT